MGIYTSISANLSKNFNVSLCDEQHIREYVSLLTLPVEFRITNSPQGVISGYFDDAEKLIAECEGLSGGLGIEAVYTTLNPVNPALMARSYNRIKSRAKHTTSDADITKRFWLPIDGDAVRPAGISATDEEREAAIAVVRSIRSYLTEQGFPDSLLGDSGNGGHGLYRVDLPNTLDVAETMRQFLERLAVLFDTDRVKLDRTVFNAARIWKVYGTKVCKGDEVGDRRHRLARILELPQHFEPVPLGLLQKVVGQDRKPVTSLPDQQPHVSTTGDREAFDRSRLLAERVIEQGGLEIVKKKDDYRGGVLWVLDRCPFCDNADRTAHVAVQADGKLCFSCKHNRCQGKGWKEFRAKCDPGHAVGKASSTWIEEMIAQEAATVAGPKPAGNTVSSRSLPIIVVNGGQLREVTEQAMTAIRAANQPPMLFRRGQEAVEMGQDESQTFLKDMKSEDVLALLSEVADWKKERRTKTGTHLEDAHPPENVVKTVRSRLASVLPEVRAIVEAPVFTAAGRLLLQAGYDAESRLYFSPGKGLEMPPIPEEPTPDDIRHAKDLLFVELMGDFPFQDDASKAHALAALLLPFVRPLIEGPTPLHFIDAPSEGTGKGKLADVICVPATGRDAPKMTEVQGESEWVKTLFATLRSAPVFVHLDNVRHPLDSAALASVLTAYPDWQARLLGASVLQNVPVMTTWLATGNNVHASKEITRRIVRIRLDAKMEHPNTRTGFRHPQLVPWAKQHRAELLWAALTLCSAWMAAGRPSGCQTLGSYECWAGVMGGILDVAGVPGFLANTKALYEEVNTSEGKWREFVLAWAEQYKSAVVGVADLYNLTVNRQLALHDDLVEKSRGRGEQSQRIQLGFLLANRLHQCYGDWRIERAGDDRNGRLYRLVSLSTSESPRQPAEEETGQLSEPPALIPLPQLTRGEIPLDIPYTRSDYARTKDGSFSVDFWLTESQQAGLSRDVKSRLKDRGHGGYSWRVRPHCRL